MPDLVPILLPVGLCVGLGYGWVRVGRAYDRNLLSTLITDVGAPCLVFSQLSTLDLPGSSLLVMVLGSIATMLSCALVGGAVLRLLGMPVHTFLAPIAFGNTGNLGLPICLFAFGERGLALAIAWYSMTAISQFTVGIWLWRGQVSFDALARTPLSWAALAAVAVQGFELEVPLWLARTTELLGGFAIPLMLVTLGVSLGELTLGRVPRSLLVAALRLGVGFAAGVAIVEGLGLTGVVRGVVLIEAAMPSAIFNYLLAQRYGRAPEEVASVVVLSTLLSIPFLPFLVTYALG